MFRENWSGGSKAWLGTQAHRQQVSSRANFSELKKNNLPPNDKAQVT
jgi:hypothetical protein